jgi:hypothetical protein
VVAVDFVVVILQTLTTMVVAGNGVAANGASTIADPIGANTSTNHTISRWIVLEQVPLSAYDDVRPSQDSEAAATASACCVPESIQSKVVFRLY